MTSALQTLFLALAVHTLQADITLSVTASDADPVTYQGTVCMHADSFRLAMLAMDAAYDGQTLYIYQAEADELTLSLPNEEELLQTNPMLYAKAIAPLCDIRERDEKNGTQTVLTLTPKDKSSPLLNDILSVTVRMRNADTIPLSVEIRQSQSTTCLTLVDAVYVNHHAPFLLTADDYPDAYLNDLR